MSRGGGIESDKNRIASSAKRGVGSPERAAARTSGSGVCEMDGDCVCDGVALRDAVAVPEGDWLCEAVLDREGVPLCDGELVGEGDPVSVRVWL